MVVGRNKDVFRVSSFQLLYSFLYVVLRYPYLECVVRGVAQQIDISAYCVRCLLHTLNIAVLQNFSQPDKCLRKINNVDVL